MKPRFLKLAVETVDSWLALEEQKASIERPEMKEELPGIGWQLDHE